MKILFINAPYLRVYGALNVGRNFAFPLGMGYIAAVLRRAGHEVRLLDPDPLRMDDHAIADYIAAVNPELIGIGGATPNFSGARHLADLIKQTSKAPIVLGGVHLSALPEQTMTETPAFDIGVIGEGEVTMTDLAAALAAHCTDLDAIPGLIFRRDGQLIRTAPRPHITDLDSLPFPARDLVDLHLYRPQVHLYRGRMSATMITSRGCPAFCTFCAAGLTMGHGFRCHSPEYVVSEIEHLYSLGVRDLLIVDDTFTISPKRVREICELLLQKNLDVGWFCFARVNNASEELYSLMKRAGCYSMLFGVESADDQVLKNIRKGATVEQARKAVPLANRLGFKTEASFMFGNPGDTRETCERTIRLALELNPVIGSFNVMTPYPGTEEYERIKQAHPDWSPNWDSITPKAIYPVIESPELTKEDLQRLMVRAFIRFYIRPSQIWRILKNISTPSEFFVYLRGAFGLFRRMLQWSWASLKT